MCIYFITFLLKIVFTGLEKLHKTEIRNAVQARTNVIMKVLQWHNHTPPLYTDGHTQER